MGFYGGDASLLQNFGFWFEGARSRVAHWNSTLLVIFNSSHLA
ncbi:hypothetical protein [Lusitaniella coriacea]|nr:hypothetical protein [Lusitaniella coriacea]